MRIYIKVELLSNLGFQNEGPQLINVSSLYVDNHTLLLILIIII